MNPIWLVTFLITTIAIATVYLILFIQKKETFMKYWGLAWWVFSSGVVCLIAFSIFNRTFLLELWKLTDMFNILLLLFGIYSFMHVKIPIYWYKFSLYMLLMAALCSFYHMELLSFYLPISVYQSIISIFACYNMLKNWAISMAGRIAASCSFFIWGVGKSVLSIIGIYVELNSYYMIEIMLYNIINLCIFSIYIGYSRSSSELEDNLFKTIMDNVRDVLFYYKLKPEPSFMYISPSIKQLTGFSQIEFYNNPYRYLQLGNERQINILTDIFNGNVPLNEPYIIELTNKAGENFWGEFNYSIIRDDEGNSIAVEGTLRDVTKIKTSQMEQIKLNTSRNNLFSYISHELRTPITSIAGYLTALGDDVLATEDERKEAMDIITSKTFMLKKLIDDLDQLSKMASNQFAFNYAIYSVDEAVNNILESSLPEIKSANFKYKINYDYTQLKKYELVMDRERIIQVFTNLISNAIKYSNENKFIELTFKTDDRKDDLVISVLDKGIGIKEEEIPNIFNRFYRASANGRRTEGRGLGLTICKEIIEAHHGEIYVESTYGQGSVFTFILPLYKEV